MKAMPKDVIKFLSSLEQWGDTRSRKRVETLIDLQFSLARETQRLKADYNADFEPYLKNIAEIERRNRLALEVEALRAGRSVERALRVIKIKAELGSIEIAWSQRAEGVRGIGELIESYQKEVDEVEDYFSGL